MTLGVFFQTHSTRPVAELVLNTSAPHVVVMTSMIGLVTFYFYSSYFQNFGINFLVEQVFMTFLVSYENSVYFPLRLKHY